MRASFLNGASGLALAAMATIGAAAVNPAHALVTFDFNSLADTSASLTTGTTAQQTANRLAANTAIDTYLKGVMSAAGFGANAISMPYTAGSLGANGEKDYAGDGYVVGISGPSGSPMRGTNGIVPLTLGNTDYYGTHYTCTTTANCAVNTTTGAFSLPITNAADPNHVSTTHMATLDSYITNQQSITSQFEIDLSAAVAASAKFTKISFDFEIFPSTDPTPDLTFKFKGSDGKTYSVAYVGVDPPGSSPNATNENHNQLIGHMDIDTALICGPNCYATALYFIDWPVTIGIDNLALDNPPPPPRTNAPEPMTGALLLTGLGGLWIARRRRAQASA